MFQLHGLVTKRGGGQGWYARLSNLSDEEKLEYLEKQRKVRHAAVAHLHRSPGLFNVSLLNN